MKVQGGGLAVWRQIRMNMASHVWPCPKWLFDPFCHVQNPLKDPDLFCYFTQNIFTDHHATHCAVISSSQFTCLRPCAGWSEDTAVAVESAGRFILDPRVLGNSFLVRKPYVDLLNIIWAENELLFQQFLLLGTPGIGKTVFGFMMAHESAFRGCKVVYVRDNSIIVLQDSTRLGMTQ
jgi:hypothetical protein